MNVKSIWLWIQKASRWRGYRKWRGYRPLLALGSIWVSLSFFASSWIAGQWVEGRSTSTRWVLFILGFLSVAVALWIQAHKKRTGTLYAIECLDQSMLPWHRDAEKERADSHQDYRPISRTVDLKPPGLIVDLTPATEDLRRAVEVARQSDDETTGISVAPNMLWPIGVYLGFVAPFPNEITLVELGTPKNIRFILHSDDRSFTVNLDLECGCRARPYAATSTTHGEQPHMHKTHEVRLSLTQLLAASNAPSWGSPCCVTDLRIQLVNRCSKHISTPQPEKISWVGGRSSKGSLEKEDEGRGKKIVLKLPVSSQEAVIAWVADWITTVAMASQGKLLLRATVNKTFSVALGMHLRRMAENSSDRAAASTLWQRLFLVHHVVPSGTDQLLRVHPAQSRDLP